MIVPPASTVSIAAEPIFFPTVPALSPIEGILVADKFGAKSAPKPTVVLPFVILITGASIAACSNLKEVEIVPISASLVPSNFTVFSEPSDPAVSEVVSSTEL